MFFSFKYLLRNASETAMQAHRSHGSLHGKMNLKINQVWRAIIHLAFECSIQAHFPPSNVFYLRPSRLLFFMGQISARKRWQKPFKKSTTKLQSHDAMLPVVTSAPLFHLALLLGASCHIRRRIGGSFPPPSPPFLPIPVVGRVANPIQRRVYREHGGECR